MKRKQFFFALVVMFSSFSATLFANNVAKIGELEYATLAEAVAAVQDGETITLIADEIFTENNRYNNGGWWDGLGYSGDKSFTIDFGGKTIKQDGALNDYLIWVKNDGAKANTITLTNGTLDAGTTAYSAFATASSNAQKITINLENIKLINDNSNGAVLKIRGGAELNVKAGTIIEGKNSYVGIEAVGNNTVVNIYDDVEIYQKGTSSYVGAIVGASYNATMNIYGGYGQSSKCGIIVMSTGATINVSGGEWIANDDGTIADNNQAVLASQNNRNESGWACKSILNVTGGTFKGGYNCYGMGSGVEPDDAQINISGGNFNADPANYVKEGYVVEEENGIYTVAKSLTGEGTEASPYLINTIDDLKLFRDKVSAGNNYSGEFVKLATNIDLNNEQWLSIGTESTPFKGNFDGGDYTISNLKIVETEAKEGKAYIGFFGYAKDATIKNVTIENVDINIACLDIDHSQGHIGAVAGSLEGTSTIENVIVKGDIKVYATQEANGASRVAVIAGGNSYGNVTMKNVHVVANEGSYLKANNNTGALAGQLQGKMVFENCSSNIDVTVNKFFAGGLIGIAAGDSKFIYCHTTGDVAVVAGRAGRANDHYRVGGIAGGWADGKNNVCTLTDCSYTGNVSGVNADGSVAETLDYDGYVGRGYTLNNCAGSKVVIDGVEHVQVYNDVHGFYMVDGMYEIGTLASLKAFRDKVNAGDYFEGKTVVLTADIDLAGEYWVGIGSAYIDHGFMGNFDGKGFKIKNLTITNPAVDSDGYVYAGLFSVTEGIDQNNQNYIKNLTIENVNISTTGHIVSAAIAYPYYTIVENVTVRGNIAIKGGDYTAGALAYTRRCVNASNVTVAGEEGSAITGAQVVGGVISDIQMNGGLKAEYSNFSVSGISITGTNMVGGISGIICEQTLNGASVNNVTLTSGDSRVGIVSGSLGGVSTITGVTYDNVEGATVIVGATYDGGAAVEAKIGDTYYATLDAAMKAAGNEEVVDLLTSLTLTDTEDYTFNKAVRGDVTYERNLPLVNAWLPLYVPFALQMSDEFLANYDIAYFNTVIGYDDNGDYVTDRTIIELIKITNANAKIKANYPLLIRAKNEDALNMEFTMSDVTLSKAEEKAVTIHSVSSTYEIKGTCKKYEKLDSDNQRVIGLNEDGKVAWGKLEDGYPLNPGRLILTITDREGADLPFAGAISMRVVGEDETTSIDDVEMTGEQAEHRIYDLQGRRVLEPQKGGLYIVNGKKIVF